MTFPISDTRHVTADGALSLLVAAHTTRARSVGVHERRENRMRGRKRIIAATTVAAAAWLTGGVGGVGGDPVALSRRAAARRDLVAA